MKFSRQIIGLAVVTLTATAAACGLGLVGEAPAAVVNDGGSSTLPPPGPVEDAGGNSSLDAGHADASVALEFDGIGDFVRVRRPVQDDFTLEAWIQTSTSRDGGAFYEGLPILWADVAGDHEDFAMSTLKGKLAFGAKNTTVSSDASVSTGAWVHVAVTRAKNRGAIALYVNGQPDATGAGPNTTLDDSATLDIGGDLADGRFFKGRIREVRAWSVVRTAAEISANINTRLVGNETGLVAYWRLDDGAGIIAADSTDGGKNPGTLGDADAGADASTRPTWVIY